MLGRKLAQVQAHRGPELQLKHWFRNTVLCSALAAAFPAALGAATPYQVYVTNERSGDVTVINGGDFSVAATIPVGKRPRGIHISPDGKGVLDVGAQKLRSKLNAGSDPEEFALSKDGRQIYISNEDTKSASVINIALGKLQHIIPVGQEPEGVTTTPDGKQFYVTCEAGGDIYVIDAHSYAAVG